MDKVKQANDAAIDRINHSRVLLIRAQAARQEIDEMDTNQKTIMYAGPEIEFKKMCDVMKQAIYGAIVYEGWAKDLHGAEVLAASGKIRFLPGADYGVAARGAGIVSPSMPVLVFRNANTGVHSKITIGDGFKQSLNFGSTTDETLMCLKWQEQTFAPILNEALTAVHGFDMAAFWAKQAGAGRNAAQALGDALTELLYATAHSDEEIEPLVDFIQKDTTFFLNVTFGVLKVLQDSINHIPYCSLVTNLCSNGVTYGFKLSCSDKWYQADCKDITGGFDPDKDLIIGDFYCGEMSKNEIHLMSSQDTAPLKGVELISKLPGIGLDGTTMVSLPFGPFKLALQDFNAKNMN